MTAHEANPLAFAFAGVQWNTIRLLHWHDDVVVVVTAVVVVMAVVVVVVVVMVMVEVMVMVVIQK